jgi:hypothetical protein
MIWEAGERGRLDEVAAVDVVHQATDPGRDRKRPGVERPGGAPASSFLDHCH